MAKYKTKNGEFDTNKDPATIDAHENTYRIYDPLIIAYQLLGYSDAHRRIKRNKKRLKEIQKLTNRPLNISEIIVKEELY